MGEDTQQNFLYLNGQSRWENFKLSGLAIDANGIARLDSLPVLETDPPAELATLPPPNGPAGIAFGPNGSLFFTQPDSHRILWRDACNPDGPFLPLPCTGGEGREPTQFIRPAGLLYHARRRALFVADSGNDRIQIFDAGTFQLLDVWGRSGNDPGCFVSPQSLATDSKGKVYVLDHGNQRVQKFDLRGMVQPGFWQTIQTSMAPCQLPPLHPMDIAVGLTATQEIKIYILDANAGLIHVFDEDGRFERSFGHNLLESPLGLAADKNAIYVGNHPASRSGRILQFDNDGRLVGEAVGYEGPVTALALDSQDGLWVQPGGALAPIRLAATKGFAQTGSLCGGPFKNPGSVPLEWHRFEATVALDGDAHFQFFVFASPDGTPPSSRPGDPQWAGSALPYVDGFVPGQWLALPINVDAGMIPAAQPDAENPDLPRHLNYIWIGAEFHGTGGSSPALSQIRLEFDHKTYLSNLPAIYGENDDSRRFLGRFLSLFESLFDDVEREIRGLPGYFDPAAVSPEWLAWLAGWLALDLDENQTESQQRQAIAQAFKACAERGTPQGLQKALRRFAGIEAHIEEPLLSAAWWSLPSNNGASTPQAAGSVLGFTTMLAPAEAQGAVLGATAILDESHLIADDEFCAPLFRDLAHQFNVLVYRSQVNTEQKLSQLRALIEREKPAHTACHLCVIGPRLRIGFQARLGIDTVIAGPAAPDRLGDTAETGLGYILGGTPAGKIGQSRIGITTRLEGTSVDGPALVI